MAVADVRDAGGRRGGRGRGRRGRATSPSRTPPRPSPRRCGSTRSSSRSPSTWSTWSTPPAAATCSTGSRRCAARSPWRPAWSSRWSAPATTSTCPARSTSSGSTASPRPRASRRPAPCSRSATTSTGCPARPTREPVFGLAAKWVPVELQRQAEMAGATVVDRSSVITTHLAEVVRQNAADLLGREDVRLLVEMVRRTHPVVVEELTPTLLTLGEVQRVLHALLEEGVSIRDLVRIFEALSVRAKTSTDLDGLVEAARAALGSAISHPYVTPDERLHVFTLDPGFEQRLLESVRQSDAGARPRPRRRRHRRPGPRLQRPARGGRAVGPVPRPRLLAPGPGRPRPPDAPGPSPASGDLLRRGLPDSADRVAGSCERCRCDPLRPPRATTRSPRRASSSARRPGWSASAACAPAACSGFFATERYVAEVAPDVARPAVPAVDRRRAAEDDAPADFSSPLASAAPARARATAPARNGAAAWAAEAARARDARRRAQPSSRSPRGAARAAAPAWHAEPARRRRTPRPADDDRVSELAVAAGRRSRPSRQPRPTPAPRSRAPRSRAHGHSRDDAGDDRAPPRRARLPADVRRRALPVHRRARPDGGRGPGRPAGGRGSTRPTRSGAPRRRAGPGRSGPCELQSHRCRRLRRARRRKRWEIRSSRRPPARRQHGGGAHLGGRARGRRAVGLLPRGGDRRGAALRPRPGPLGRGARRDPAQGARRGVPADGPDRARGPERSPAAGRARGRRPAASWTPAPRSPSPSRSSRPLPSTSRRSTPSPRRRGPPPPRPPRSPPSRRRGAAYEAPVPRHRCTSAVVRGRRSSRSPRTSRRLEPAYEVAASTPRVRAPAHEGRSRRRHVRGARVRDPPVEPAGTSLVGPLTWTPAPAWVALRRRRCGTRRRCRRRSGASPSGPVRSRPHRRSGPRSVRSTRVGADPAPVDAVRCSRTRRGPLAEASAERRVDESVEDAGGRGAVVEESVAEEPAVERARGRGDRGRGVRRRGVRSRRLVEAVAEELAPVLARTASDPAPMMSFDSTSVMPPLSLLPPLPGSRGRGRPPVPPAPSRRSASSSAAADRHPLRPETRSCAPTARVRRRRVGRPRRAGRAVAGHRDPAARRAAAWRARRCPSCSEPVESRRRRCDRPSRRPAARRRPARSPTGSWSSACPASLLGATFADDVAERAPTRR